MNEIERDELFEKIENFVDEEIRGFLNSDGGDIQLIELKLDGTLRVMLQGACSHCSSSIMTLQFGVQNRIMEAFPEVKGLELAGPAFDLLDEGN